MESSLLTFRRAKEADLEALLTLMDALHVIHFDARPDLFVVQLPVDFANMLGKRLTSEHNAIFLAMRDSSSIGFISASIVEERQSVMRDGFHCWIDAIYVNHSEWGNGIGRSLMNLAEQWAIKQGAEYIRLSVSTFN